MDTKFKVAWLLWLAAFVVIELWAVADKNNGTVTLSEFTWHITSRPVPWFIFLAFMIWLSLHLLTKGRIG